MTPIVLTETRCHKQPKAYILKMHISEKDSELMTSWFRHVLKKRKRVTQTGFTISCVYILTDDNMGLQGTKV